MVEKLNDADLHSRVKQVLEKVVFKAVQLDNLAPETRLLEDLDVDSARLVDLVLNLEDEFAISIEDERIDRLKTYDDVLDLVRTKAA